MAVEQVADVAARMGGTLEPFQWAGVRYLLDARSGALEVVVAEIDGEVASLIMDVDQAGSLFEGVELSFVGPSALSSPGAAGNGAPANSSSRATSGGTDISCRRVARSPPGT